MKLYFLVIFYWDRVLFIEPVHRTSFYFLFKKNNTRKHLFCSPWLNVHWCHLHPSGTQSIPHKKYRGVPKGARGVVNGKTLTYVIQGCVKGRVHAFISGMQKYCILYQNYNNLICNIIFCLRMIHPRMTSSIHFE